MTGRSSAGPRRWYRRPALELGAVGLLAAAVLLPGLGRVPVLGRDEARFAQAAREMRAADEWVVPTFGGEPRYHKPILVYWAMRASYAAAGVNARAARLPSVLAATATLLLVAAAARCRLGPGAGLAAATLLAAAPVFFAEARAATADLVTLLPTVAAMLALERLVRGSGGDRHALVLWLGLALATLGKGPVGPMVAGATLLALWASFRPWGPGWRWTAAGLAILGLAGLGPLVLAVPVVAAFVDLVRRDRLGFWMRRLRVAWGLPLALAAVLPWAVAAATATGGEFLRAGIGHHVVARALTPFESHGGFPGFFPVTAVVAAFPWFAALLAGAAGRHPDGRFLGCWVLGPLVVLELVRTKLVHYALPFYPAAVLLVVGWIWRSEVARLGRPAKTLMLVGGFVLAVAPLAVAARLGLADLQLPGLITGLPVVIGTITVAAGHASARRDLAAAAVGGLATLLLLAGWFLPRLAPALVGPRVAAAVAEHRAAHEPVALYHPRDDELLFELPLTTEILRTESALAERWGTARGLLVVGRVEDLESFLAEHPGLTAEVAAAVPAVELTRVRWVELALVRATGRETSG